MRRTLPLLFLVLILMACGSQADGSTLSNSTTSVPATTTESTPDTTISEPAVEPITFTGTGSFTSEPVALAGSYRVTFDFADCPIAGADLFPIDDSLLEMHSAGDATGTGETNIHNVTPGDWYLEVYSCPKGWTVTLTPS